MSILINEEEYRLLANNRELIKDSFKYKVIETSDNMLRTSLNVSVTLERDDGKYFQFTTRRVQMIDDKYELYEVFPITITKIIYQ